MNHDQDYPADYLATILKEVKTIAMVGASSDPTKFSYGVLRVLHETGYDMVPVNPNEPEVEGTKTFAAVTDIPVPLSARLPFSTASLLPPSLVTAGPTRTRPAACRTRLGSPEAPPAPGASAIP